MARWRQLAEEEKVLWGRVMSDVVPLRNAADDAVKDCTATQISEPEKKPARQSKSHAGAPYFPSEVLSRDHTFPAFFAPVSPASAQVQRQIHPADKIGRRSPGIDDQSWRNFEQGKTRVQRRLDLHGLVAQEAYHRLLEFMDVSYRQGLRCVEIITGLGSGGEGGILRRELPFWLDRPELRARMLGVVYPHAANRGAVKILLRRRRV
ncbi:MULTISPECIES: Smr/MutS family protein [Acetobacter]|uniref:Smr/MutS family protein n=1 Tax=Acetobacter TaxID=434 RepID=UPI000B739A13|nr:hypothetical protein HK25_09525 [Acetobacter sp. DsW_059]